MLLLLLHELLLARPSSYAAYQSNIMQTKLIQVIKFKQPMKLFVELICPDVLQMVKTPEKGVSSDVVVQTHQI